MKPKQEHHKYLKLFLTMLKIGIFTFGGGYAMIALLENELVEKKEWIGREEFLDMVAVSESTPGPIAVNCATYVGYHVGGVLGSETATLGVVLPSFVIIFLISQVLEQFLALELIGRAFRGIQVCVIYLILSSGLNLLKSIEKNALNVLIVTAVMCCMVLFSLFAVKISAILYIVICGCIGLAAGRVVLR